ncbi:MAG: permease-like cell division protein FtsX [Clostridia bacterium]|nr:permease-like cell division protein FtsX [Clostridia bacterium]
MRLSSLGYLIKEGFRNIKQNAFMAVASILVLVSCLLLSGSAYLVFVNIESAFDYVYSQNVAVVFAAETADEAAVAALGEQIRALSNVSDVELISKEDTLTRYEGVIPEATFEQLQGTNNPFLDSYKVTFIDLDDAVFKSTIQSIKDMPNVDDVSYNGDIAATLAHLRSVVMLIGGVVIIVLLFVSLFIISNTIKLTVYSRRLEIGIMKSVGATKAFIRLPFMWEGMVLGFAAGLLSYGIMHLIYTRLMAMPALGFISFTSLSVTGLSTVMPVWAELLVGFLVIGVLTGMLGSGLSMGRYLKEESGVSSD